MYLFANTYSYVFCDNVVSLEITQLTNLDKFKMRLTYSVQNLASSDSNFDLKSFTFMCLHPAVSRFY